MESVLNLKSGNNKDNKKKSILLNLDSSLIKEIKEKNGKVDINILNPTNNIKTICSYRNESKNFYYYHCKKRRNCKDSGKIYKDNYQIEITNNCTDNENHKKLNYNEFESLYINKKLNLVDFNIKKIKYYYLLI